MMFENLEKSHRMYSTSRSYTSPVIVLKPRNNNIFMKWEWRVTNKNIFHERALACQRDMIKQPTKISR